MREWAQYPRDIELDTPLGSVFVSITSDDHVYVDASGNGKFLTVPYKGGHSKQFAVSMHLYRTGLNDTAGWTLIMPDSSKDHGGFHTMDEIPHKFNFGAGRWHGLHMTPWQSFEVYPNLPRSAVQKVVETLVPLVSSWLERHPDLVYQAGVADRNNRLQRLEKDLAEANDKVQEIHAAIRKVKAEGPHEVRDAVRA